ncbi:MAG TPA: hypothetical protein VLT87_05735 [Thermoanaerobaculia bacterium]|nr:hypothetical protein [Thermoanaerobaculia bacterium]
MAEEHNPFHGPWVCTGSSGNPHFNVDDEFVIREDMEQPENAFLTWGAVKGTFVLQEDDPGMMKGTVWKEDGKEQPAILRLIEGPEKIVTGEVKDGRGASDLTGTWEGKLPHAHEHNPFHGLWLCYETSGNPHFKEDDEPVIREDIKHPEIASLNWGAVQGRFVLQEKDKMEGTVWKDPANPQPATLKLVRRKVMGEIRDGAHSSELTGTWGLKTH